MSSHHTKPNLKETLESHPAPGNFNRIKHGFGRARTAVKNRLPKRRWARRLLVGIFIFIVALGVFVTAVAQWYIHSGSNRPEQIGVTFIPYYASSLGIDPQQTMDALTDIGVDHFRLVSYWNAIESKEGEYDFSTLDWQFEKAEASGATVSLALGLRQPRWPECHMPGWAKGQPRENWQPKLEAFIAATVDRYKSSPSLQSYQLENEYFNTFGECSDFSRDRLVSEYQLVKRHDSQHPVIVSRSNNTPLLALGEPRPDIVGVSIYRRVWDAQFTKQYFNYPLPTWYYAFNAGLQKIVTGRDSVIHELQMEPWPPAGKFITDVSLEEQDKSMNASMFADRIEFARDTGMHQYDLWGAEWWYWRMEVKNDPSLWNEAKKAFARD